MDCRVLAGLIVGVIACWDCVGCDQSPFVSKAGAVRFLNLHEYQSKDLMESYGVVVQPGRMAASPAEALEIATKLQAEST